ncbi:MAG TPA: PSD1 and planctomycete cytochrome C domain-containing protein, partial [Vicinamibacteria bacterium]
MCHNALLAQAGLRLDSREAALKGGLSGPALVPGDGQASLLVKRLLGTEGGIRMPQNMEPWPSERIALVRRWIDEGASWPAAAAVAPVSPASVATPPSPATVAARAGDSKKAAGSGKAVDFVRDVAPIFREHCVSCHGPAVQESRLRLDSRSLALRGGLSGKVIVPGQSVASPLVQRLAGQITPSMPFKQAALPAAKLALIRAWIDAGATGPEDTPVDAKVALHWAYEKPRKVAPPAPKGEAWGHNAVDAFVLARLEREGLRPAPEADRETLLRRTSLDLVGLPPTLAEVDAFVADRSPDAYEKVVDRLLASPHYGERWSRPWLDLARYADSNGYEKDNLRTAWKYRDYVISALNRDLSFRDFTIEQLAGDMLKDASVDQKIATGFHRNSQLNQEGGIDVEEARFETLLDRVNTTGAVFLGSTLGCAQCHNHKFDPFSQKDYYKLVAFYDNVRYSVFGQGEEVVDRWIVEPELELPSEEQAKQRAALRAEAAPLRVEIEQRNLEAELQAFAAAARAPAPAWTALEVTGFEATSGSTGKARPDGSVLVAGEVKDADSYTVKVATTLAGITAFRLEALPDESLPKKGPGRAGSGAFVVTEVAVAEGGRKLDLDAAAVDLMERRRTPNYLVDGHLDTGWGVTEDSELGKPHHAVLRVRGTERPPATSAASSAKRTLTFTLSFEPGWPHVRSSLGRFRISATRASNPWGGLPLPEAVPSAADTPVAARSAEQQAALDAWWRPLSFALYAPRARLRQIDRELADMKVVTTLVMEERAGFERPSTFFRNRGSFMSPGDRVFAAIPAVFGSLPDDQPPNRLGLARWLVSDDNPLTARVTVNRIWEAAFGRGLVLTSEDFGSQGERPSHPELLDWLAVEFMEKGWSQKAILRTIVTSAAYRQSSRAAPALVERDPDNRLLARGPRFRVEAEMVRDLVLSASGLLSSKVGGPSVYPWQPEGIWNVPYSRLKWETSQGEDLWRRSLYTTIRRSSPYPSLASFDAP